jgi:hypothetical protein
LNLKISDIEIKLNAESNSLSEESAKIFFNLSPAIIDIAINEGIINKSGS